MDSLDTLSQSTKLTERIQSHKDMLALDFQQKVQGVYNAVATDFVVSSESGDIFKPVLDENGNLKKFDTEMLHAFLRRTSNLASNPNQMEDGSKYASEVMNQLYKIAALFPNRIPQYFNGYTVNPSLTKYPHVEKGRTYMTYFPDNAIEAWQVEKESVILFALDEANKGRALPQTWNELKTMYEESVNSEEINNSP